MPLMKMQHAADPKEEILAKFKDVLDEVELTGPSMLIAIYKRPEKTAGGLYLTDEIRNEDKYQGKAGLILKMGPFPFDEDDKKFFGDNLPKVGDWVMCRASDGMPFVLGGMEGDCRLFDERRLLKMIINYPDSVW